MQEKTRQKLESVTKEIVDMIEKKGLSWIKGWNSGFQKSAQTGEIYNGFNQLYLMHTQQKQQYTSNIWLTFLQCQKMGGHIKKGEKGYPIFFYDRFIKKEIDKKGEEKDKTVFFMKTFTVFNLNQTSIEIQEEQKPFNTIAQAETLLLNSGADIRYSDYGRCYYQPQNDFIHLPFKKHFHTEQAFYATAFHELAHWSGHESRLNRSLKGKFGNEEYAFEELIAELGSTFLLNTFGITDNNDNNAAYLQHWLKVLKSDPKAIYKAANEAFKIFEYLGAFMEEERVAA